MASERNYRAEANAARKAARDKLIAFREARRQSRAPSANPTRQQSASAENTSIAPDTLFDMSATDASDDTPMNPSPEATKGAVAQLEELDTSESDDQSDGVEDEGADGTPTERVSAGDGGSATSDPQEETQANSASEDVDDAPGPPHDNSTAGAAMVPSDSDLFRLPGAGAGIVWILQQCGVHSLSDLAQTDADELSAKLGVVGHILNIKPWIKFAEEAED